MTKYNVSPLVAREIEFSTGTIFGGSWCRYFISITLHQCYIEATWKTRPKNDLDGHKEIFELSEEEADELQQIADEAKGKLFTLLFGPLYHHYVSQYVLDQDYFEEEEQFIKNLLKYYNL